jgi:Peptidase family M23
MANGTFPLLLGAGTLAAIWWGRGRRSLATKADQLASPKQPPVPPGKVPPQPLPGRWVWPVPIWRGRHPVISSGWGTPRTTPQGPVAHEGADVMFRRIASDPYPVHSPNGSKGFVMPDGVLAIAAADGAVWSAGWTPRGFSVVIDHGDTGKIATYYTHLEKLLVTPTARGRSGQRVRAGEPLGIIGADPMDGNHLKHLHFAIWRGGPKDAIDPEPLMKPWAMVIDPREAQALITKPSQLAALSPSQAVTSSTSSPAVTPAATGNDVRNAGLLYRPLGASGEPYPEWVRALRGKSGVYVIREITDGAAPQIVYVGQSGTGRLYETLTRHFQTWRRWKSFWGGQFSEGHDPGMTYRRDRVEVAIRTTSASRALDEEARLIRKLHPRDNVIGQPDGLDPVPF